MAAHNSQLATRNSQLVMDLLLLAGIETFMMVFLDVRVLFYDTTATGGDTASWQGVADHLLNVLLPQGRLTGWDLGNFCGYPNFSFYFLPPFLLAALPSYLFGLPLTITLKVAISLGAFLLPVMTYLGLRAMSYRFPGPVIGAAATLLFLFNESYTMFGGNLLSTYTGEFCYMFAFALLALFMGTLYRGVKRESGAVSNGVLLGLIGLSHLFVFIPAVCLVVYWFLARGRLRYLLKVSLVAFGLMAFWILPLIAFRHPFTTPVYMIWQPFVSWRYTFLGLGLGLLFVGPRLSLAALAGTARDSFKRLGPWAACLHGTFRLHPRLPGGHLCRSRKRALRHRHRAHAAQCLPGGHGLGAPLETLDRAFQPFPRPCSAGQRAGGIPKAFRLRALLPGVGQRRPPSGGGHGLLGPLLLHDRCDP